MAFKPIDPKRDEFRRYLERAGVIEALTKVFLRLENEKPENPMEYLQHNLGDARLQADNMAYLNSELEEARSEIQRLRSIIESVPPNALTEACEDHNKTARHNNTRAAENGGDVNPELDNAASNESALSPQVNIKETEADTLAENTSEKALENENNVSSK